MAKKYHMKELTEFLQKEFPEGCSIMTPQFERTEKLEYEWKPENDKEFISVTQKASWEILKGLGFRKWDTLNNVISENQTSGGAEKVEVPIINSEETVSMEVGSDDAPTTLVENDQYIILIPGEWYDIVPNGFEVTGLYGEQYPFEKGKSDPDIRYGCLPYGILKDVKSIDSPIKDGEKKE